MILWMRLLFLLQLLTVSMPISAAAQFTELCLQCKTESTPKCLRKCDSKFTKEDRIECIDECKAMTCSEKCAQAESAADQPEKKPVEPRNIEESCKFCLDRYKDQCKSECTGSKDGKVCVKRCLDKHCSNLCYLPDSMSTNQNQLDFDPALCDRCKGQAEYFCKTSKRCKAGVPGSEACKFRCEREACKTACHYAD